MACYSQEEIAQRENVTKETVSQVCQDLANLPKSDEAAASHAVDFDPPIYNIWKQQTKSEGSSHFGNSEVRWVWHSFE
jgi:transcriptional regulator with XRE-family HTH domain